MSADTRVDLTVVVTAHREGTLAHHTLRALRRAVELAVEAGISVRVQLVLDSPDLATRDFMHEAVGPGGYFDGLCDSHLTEVTVRDPGLARNAAVRRSVSDHVAVLDADNLPSANWLVEGVRTLRAAGSPAIVHPEQLVTFGERSEVWPQLPCDDERFIVANFYDRNYWDTVCLTDREVLERFPYSATSALGYGFEDWHWYSRTLGAGVAHLVAADTAYFYRVKPGDSVNSVHHARGSLLPPTELLLDSSIAKQVAESPILPPARRKVRTRQVRQVLRAWRTGAQRKAPAKPPRRRERWLGLWLGSPVVPAHYRLLYPDLEELTDRELRWHYRTKGRADGRRPCLSEAELAAMRPEVFDVRHYRIIHADLAALDDADAVRHFLAFGRGEGRRTLLSDSELAALSQLDVEDYVSAYPDLWDMDRDQAVAHFLSFGRRENRLWVLPPGERTSWEPISFSETMLDNWRAVHELEPLVPIPTADRVRHLKVIGPQVHAGTTAASLVWWRVLDALGALRPHAIFFAPWLRMGGADLLIARYAQTVAELRPDWTIVVITTHAGSASQSLLPSSVRLLELPEIEGYDDLAYRQRRDLIANLVVQLGPELAHIINSPEAYDAFEYSSRAMTQATRIFLTTFVIDRDRHGEMHSYLTKRRPGFLDDAEGVIVDNQALVEQLVELYRYPRDKFQVHHQAVELPPRAPARERVAGEPLRVLWAARFDRQKRLDVLADLVEAATREGLAVEWHVFGGVVIDSPADTQEILGRLVAAGAVLHGTYSADNPLDFATYDAFLLTSEFEGIPLTLLDVMAARLPVIAAAVGGVPELIDAQTGFPVADHEDVLSYLAALRILLDSPEKAWKRAEVGYQRLITEYSWTAFKERIRATPGYLDAAR